MKASKMKGFTAVEVLIVIAILGILIALGINAYNGKSSGTISYGFNGALETRCVGGHFFVIGPKGQLEQVLDSKGNGVPCLK